MTISQKPEMLAVSDNLFANLNNIDKFDLSTRG